MADVEITPKAVLEAHNRDNEYGVTDDDLLETLCEADWFWEGNRNAHRWWDCIDRVATFNGYDIMYTWAEANRDEGVQDLGWNFSWDSLSFAEAEVTQTTIYKRK